MNTTNWKAQCFATADEAAAFLAGMKNEWDALNSKVVFSSQGIWVIYPIPFSDRKE